MAIPPALPRFKPPTTLESRRGMVEDGLLNFLDKDETDQRTPLGVLPGGR